MKKKAIIIVLIVALLIISALGGMCCAHPDAEPEPGIATTLTPEPTATVAPTREVMPTPTAEVEPTVAPTMEPTNTPVPTEEPTPTAAPTSTPEPTVTTEPTATPLPTATPKPTETPTPVPVKGIVAGDYVTFGSYQQTEITGTDVTAAIENATYNEAGYATVDGQRYFRVNLEDEIQAKMARTVGAEGMSKEQLYDLSRKDILEDDPVWQTTDHRYYKCEPIEWLVLEAKDGKAFLISKYALDGHQYHHQAWLRIYPDDPDRDRVDVTWETSDLRAWLGSVFLNGAFDAEERESIILTTVKNPDHSHGFEGGNDTKDKVYLLSGEEATYYFGEAENRKNLKAATTPTGYAKTRNIGYIGDKAYAKKWYDKNADWWLRSPGMGTNWASYVHAAGVYMLDGCYVIGTIGVRPVLWLDVENASVEKVK